MPDIAVAHAGSPYVTAYPWTPGSGFGTKYPNPSTLPAGTGRGAAFCIEKILFHVNIGGSWRRVTQAWVNIGGVWKTVTDVWVNIGGTWKQAAG